MRRLFTMMWEQVQSTAQQLRHWWTTLSPDPHTWLPFTWVLLGAAIVTLLFLLLRPRRRKRKERPELLISRGELRLADGEPSQGTALTAAPEGAYRLSMTVSNLSAVPVQLLELAVRSGAGMSPVTVEVPALLPPHGAVEVSAELHGAGGDEGSIELFVYAPDLPPKTFRVRARLRWEPWDARFKVLSLDQSVVAVPRPAERRPHRPPRGEPGKGAGAAKAPGHDTLVEPVRFEPRPGSERPRSRPEPTPTGAAEERGPGVWPPVRPPRPPADAPATVEPPAGPQVPEKATEGREDAARARAERRVRERGQEPPGGGREAQSYQDRKRAAERRAETLRREAEQHERERQEVERRFQERQRAANRPAAPAESAPEPADQPEPAEDAERPPLEFPDEF